jgi:hypothetical protein
VVLIVFVMLTGEHGVVKYCLTRFESPVFTAPHPELYDIYGTHPPYVAPLKTGSVMESSMFPFASQV